MADATLFKKILKEVAESIPASLSNKQGILQAAKMVLTTAASSSGAGSYGGAAGGTFTGQGPTTGLGSGTLEGFKKGVLFGTPAAVALSAALHKIGDVKGSPDWKAKVIAKVLLGILGIGTLWAGGGEAVRSAYVRGQGTQGKGEGMGLNKKSNYARYLDPLKRKILEAAPDALGAGAYSALLGGGAGAMMAGTKAMFDPNQNLGEEAFEGFKRGALLGGGLGAVTGGGLKLSPLEFQQMVEPHLIPGLAVASTAIPAFREYGRESQMYKYSSLKEAIKSKLKTS